MNSLFIYISNIISSYANNIRTISIIYSHSEGEKIDISKFEKEQDLINGTPLTRIEKEAYKTILR